MKKRFVSVLLLFFFCFPPLLYSQTGEVYGEYGNFCEYYLNAEFTPSGSIAVTGVVDIGAYNSRYAGYRIYPSTNTSPTNAQRYYLVTGQKTVREGTITYVSTWSKIFNRFNPVPSATAKMCTPYQWQIDQVLPGINCETFEDGCPAFLPGDAPEGPEINPEGLQPYGQYASLCEAIADPARTPPGEFPDLRLADVWDWENVYNGYYLFEWGATERYIEYIGADQIDIFPPYGIWQPYMKARIFNTFGDCDVSQEQVDDLPFALDCSKFDDGCPAWIVPPDIPGPCNPDIEDCPVEPCNPDTEDCEPCNPDTDDCEPVVPIRSLSISINVGSEDDAKQAADSGGFVSDDLQEMVDLGTVVDDSLAQALAAIIREHLKIETSDAVCGLPMVFSFGSYYLDLCQYEPYLRSLGILIFGLASVGGLITLLGGVKYEKR
jgi:hypothetical protein